MADRTIKLMGKAYAPSGSVSLVVNWNNTEVHNGPVTTSTDTIPLKPVNGDMVELASWTISTDDIGSFPLTIAVSGGSLHFQQLNGNYSGYEAHLTTADNEVPGTLSGERVIDVQPVDWYGEINVNSADSDGKNNVVITNADGDAPSRDVTVDGGGDGDWIYRIDDGATFSCDYAVDAAVLFVTVP